MHTNHRRRIIAHVNIRVKGLDVGTLPVFIISLDGNIMTCKIYLVQKETQCFHLQFWGLKIIDFKNCFNSVVLPSNKDLDCIVSS